MQVFHNDHGWPVRASIRREPQAITRAGQIKGFTLYATRTILSGGGEELIELTKTNLRELEVE